MSRLRALLAAAVVVLPAGAHAQYQLEEGFAGVSTLAASGWVRTNLSAPSGGTAWFQGNPNVFAAATGAPDSYVGANYNNTGSVGTISNWLITPVVTLFDGATLSFQTRAPSGTQWADRLEVRLSTAGAGTDVGATALSTGTFSTLLGSVNPTLVADGYPQSWTTFSLALSGLGAPTEGRLAFRYTVPNGGLNGANSNYIGIDDVRLTAMGQVGNVSAVPEPASITLMATGVLALGAAAGVRRRR